MTLDWSFYFLNSNWITPFIINFSINETKTKTKYLFAPVHLLQEYDVR